MYTSAATIYCRTRFMKMLKDPSGKYFVNCGRPWPAAYINFNQNIHQIQILTKPLCRTQAIFYSLPNNERGTKYLGLTYSAKQTVRENCRATYSHKECVNLPRRLYKPNKY